MPKITVGVSMNIAVKRIFCASECLENSAVIVIIYRDKQRMASIFFPDLKFLIFQLFKKNREE